MTLSLPMVGVGLSYSDIGKGAELAGIMVLGSVFACAISMFWPERPTASSDERQTGTTPTLGTASAWALREPRPRRSGFYSTLNTSAGHVRRRCR
jgi:hypothetical protein